MIARVRLLACAMITTMALGMSASLSNAAMAQQPSVTPTSPSLAPSPPPVDPAIDARAREWWQRLLDANPDRKQMEPKLNAALTDNALKSAQRDVRAYGTMKSFVYIGSRSDGDDTVYQYRLTYPKATVIYGFEVDVDGKISGLSYDDGK